MGPLTSIHRMVDIHSRDGGYGLIDIHLWDGGHGTVDIHSWDGGQPFMGWWIAILERRKPAVMSVWYASCLAHVKVLTAAGCGGREGRCPDVRTSAVIPPKSVELTVTVGWVA